MVLGDLCSFCLESNYVDVFYFIKYAFFVKFLVVWSILAVNVDLDTQFWEFVQVLNFTTLTRTEQFENVKMYLGFFLDMYANSIKKPPKLENMTGKE